MVKATLYEYGRIATLAAQLEKAGIAPEIIAQIMQDGEDIGRGTAPEAKAAWMREAMLRMDRLLDRETRYAVRESCACCLGGKRGELSKAIAKNFATIEERVAAANETRFVFGNSVTQEADGSFIVHFGRDGEEHYRCACLPKAQEPLSITHCYCCGGHVKHHLQNALGHPLKVQVLSSALSSGGKRPCTFRLTLVEQPAAV
jgi:hypothetical protein